MTQYLLSECTCRTKLIDLPAWLERSCKLRPNQFGCPCQTKRVLRRILSMVRQSIFFVLPVRSTSNARTCVYNSEVCRWPVGLLGPNQFPSITQNPFLIPSGCLHFIRSDVLTQENSSLLKLLYISKSRGSGLTWTD